MYDKDAIYKQSLVRIPRPEFVVLYNGEAAYPGEMTLKLSDAFKEAPRSIIVLAVIWSLK